MIDWGLVKREYDELVSKLTNPSLDHNTRVAYQKKTTQFGGLLQFHDQISALEKTIADNKALAAAEQGEMKQLYEQEIIEHQQEVERLTNELDELLYPADERNERSVFLEIRAGAGGLEAALFAADLYKMYFNYAMTKRWEMSIVESALNDLGGYREVVAYIKGKNVYKYLRYESGVHRVQRVPVTETQGRVHTSTVTVAVLPEADDVEVSIKTEDLRIDTYRSSGAGGQHVNTTDSAIRITHLPTGLVVTCQDERSQTKNKASAMKVLRSRLLEQETAAREAQIAKERKALVGGGERSEKIRTYNYPQNRISDHRIELTLKKLDIIMSSGDLDEIIKPLMDWDLAERRKHSSILES